MPDTLKKLIIWMLALYAGIGTITLVMYAATLAAAGYLRPEPWPEEPVVVWQAYIIWLLTAYILFMTVPRLFIYRSSTGVFRWKWTLYALVPILFFFLNLFIIHKLDILLLGWMMIAVAAWREAIEVL